MSTSVKIIIRGMGIALVFVLALGTLAIFLKDGDSPKTVGVQSFFKNSIIHENPIGRIAFPAFRELFSRKQLPDILGASIVFDGMEIKTTAGIEVSDNVVTITQAGIYFISVKHNTSS